MISSVAPSMMKQALNALSTRELTLSNLLNCMPRHYKWAACNIAQYVLLDLSIHKQAFLKRIPRLVQVQQNLATTK